ncbi:MAG: ribosome-associated protein [Patiriisocius sp.]|jgi:ribosome-associated protein
MNADAFEEQISDMQEIELKQLAIEALADLKANDIRCLDVRNQTDIADYMIVASGTSSRHVSALVNNVIVEAKKAGVMPNGVEGHQTGEWVLVDLVDVVVHVMVPQAREFYDLERLWSLEQTPEENTPVEH